MTDNPEANWVVIERTFNAPVDVLWRMWTEPEHFKAWYGPEGCTVPVAKMDVRVGGARVVSMEISTPSGPMQMWYAGEYVEIVENQRLVYTEAQAGEDGAPQPADSGAPGDVPQSTEVRVEFEDLGDDRTKIVLTHVGIPADSPGASGWAGALDKLAIRLDAPTA